MDYISNQPLDNFREVWIDRYEDTFFVRDGCLRTLNDLIDKAIENGGEVLSRLWCGNNTRVTLSCRLGHVWQVTARCPLNENTWCPTCATDGQWKGHIPERPRRTFQDMLLLAHDAGVEHLGEATNLRDSTRWRCRVGHEWEEPARAPRIRGFFCQQCEGRPAKMLERAYRTALERGGQCLSMEYVNNRTHMYWVCRLGHVWSAPWKNVGTNGSWCLECANQARRKLH